MMRSRLAQFLLIFAALWLPLQSVTSVAAPFCQHGTTQLHQQEQEQASDPMMHCEQHGADHHHGDSHRPQSAGHACGACGACHLAGALAIPPTRIEAAELPQVRGFARPSAGTFVSHIPEQPQRPPRSLA